MSILKGHYNGFCIENNMRMGMGKQRLVKVIGIHWTKMRWIGLGWQWYTHTYMCCVFATRFAYGFACKVQEKEFKDYSKIFDLSISKDEIALYRGGKTVERLPTSWREK